MILFQFYLNNGSSNSINVKDYFLKHMQFASGDSFTLHQMNNLNSSVTNKINYDFGSDFYSKELANYDATLAPGKNIGFMVLIPRNNDIYDDIIVTFHQDNGEVIAMKRLIPQYPEIPTYGK